MSNGLLGLQNGIPNAISNTIDLMLKRGSNVAKEKILSSSHTQKEGDELAELVKTQKINPYKGMIHAGGNLDQSRTMSILEYGAGLVTKRHPDAAKIGWEYNINDAAHRTSVGWFYYTTPADKNPNVIVKKDGRLVAYTRYSNPVRYMYNAKKYIELNVVKVLNQKLGFANNKPSIGNGE